MRKPLQPAPACAVGWITEFGGWWTVVGALIVIVVIPCVATLHAPADWVFREFITEGGKQSGLSNDFYTFILGLLLSSYCYVGYDGPAHMVRVAGYCRGTR